MKNSLGMPDCFFCPEMDDSNRVRYRLKEFSSHFESDDCHGNEPYLMSAETDRRVRDFFLYLRRLSQIFDIDGMSAKSAEVAVFRLEDL